MSSMVSRMHDPTGRVAAIYARVSSERQRQDETIASQTVGLRELALERGLLIPEDLVFEDEGFSGATLTRPALERLRDHAADGCFEVLLCHAPDRLARRYAYQVLLLEELARSAVEVIFARGGEQSGSPEDELLRQFQGMIAEYERAQIRERTRRGKLHRARTGHQAVMAGAPYGYRFIKKTDIADGYWEIGETEAQVVREVLRRYVEDGCSIGELARWLTAQEIPTRTGKRVWDRSTVWGMLRNPAYRGQAAYGKTKVADRHGKPTRTTRARGERRGRRQVRVDESVDQWMFIPVPALVSEETFALAQERLGRNAHFAKRNTREPGPLQGLVVCRECGYACYRTSTRTTKRKIVYYRCTGQDNWRHAGGRVCQSRPIRADELEPLVWSEVRQLLENPELVRAEIDRRRQALRTEHPAARRREAIERDLTRATGAIERLIEAYQEQLISLEQLTVHEQQRILRLVVREVLVGGDDDSITIRHSIPAPTGSDDPSYLLRGSSPLTAACERCPLGARPPLPDDLGNADDKPTRPRPGQGPPQLPNDPLRGRLRRAGTRQQGPRADAQGADGRVHARAAALDALARENAHHPRRRRLRPARVSHRAPPEARSRAGRLQLPKQTSAARGHASDQGADRTHHDEPLAGSADPCAQPSPSRLDQLPPPRREQALLRLPQPLPVVASGALAAQDVPASDLETDQAAVLATHMERCQRREARLARRGRDNPLPLPGLSRPRRARRAS